MAVSKPSETVGLGSAIRTQFPIFSTWPRGHLAYLDTAASSQKPKCVIDRLEHYLSFEHANIHRGAYALSSEATENYERSRNRVAAFLNAPTPKSLVFTRSTTESINLVAYAYEKFFKSGDVILLTLLEHHSNIVPWQLLAKRKGLKIIFADIDAHGALDLNDLQKKLKEYKPKLLAITHVANSLGTVVPLAEIIPLARAQGCKVLVDAAQSVVHMKLDLQALDPDFLVFSGHKLYGPTGIGILYARPGLLDEMDPFQGGGDMISSVTVDGSTWAEAPQKFEAGTPAIAEAIALGTAVDFVDSIGRERIAAHEKRLVEEAFLLLSKEPGVTLYGPITKGLEQSSVLSFNVAGIHPHDLASIGDKHSVQFRAGHHCAMPTLKRLGIPASARISFGVYSCSEDLPPLIETIREAKKILG